MPKHVIQDHMCTDCFNIDESDVIRINDTARGGGRLSNTPVTETTLSGTKYKILGTWSNGTHHEVEIDNTNNGFKYTGTADKTLLFMASMSAKVDTNA